MVGKESKVQKMARQQAPAKKAVKTHEGCGGELVHARNGETDRMADFCIKCYSFLPKET